MLIAAGSLLQFVKFMQITLLIMLPLMVAAVAYTIYTHYRRKKKPVFVKSNEDPVMHLLNATPEVINYEEIEGDYVQFDQSAVVKEYKSKLIYSHARFTALQKDYEGLQDKCNSLLMLLETHSPTQKTAFMKNHEEISTTPILAITAAVNDDQQNPSGPGTSIDDACIQDLLEQKRTEIAFLQSQLEQRIRNFHQSEKQLAEARAYVSDADRNVSEIKEILNNERQLLTEKETLVYQLQAKLEERDAIAGENQDALLLMENNLRSTREQNEMLNAMVADHTDLVQALQTSLAAEENKVEQLQLKLDRNRQIMKRLFNEFAQYMDPESDASPVVELKAAFVKDQQAAFSENLG